MVAVGRVSVSEMRLVSKRSAALLFLAVLILIAADLLSGPPLSAQVAPQSTQADSLIAKLLQHRYGLSVRGG